MSEPLSFEKVLEEEFGQIDDLRSEEEAELVTRILRRLDLEIDRS